MIAAFVMPFEVFLFAYAFLGPLHYLTEISWLHDRKYFSTGKYDFIVLLGVGCLLGYSDIAHTYEFHSSFTEMFFELKLGDKLILLAFLSSCGPWESPELISYDGLTDFSIKEKTLTLNLNGVIENPNNKTIYIHNLDTDVMVNGRKLGSLAINERFKLLKNTATRLSIPLVISLEKGAMFKLGMLALKDSADIVLKGKVIGGGRILKKSVPFEVERTLSTKSLILP